MYVINSIVDLKRNQVQFEPGVEFNCIKGDNGASYKIIFNFKQCLNTDKISGILTFVMPDGSNYIDSIIFNNMKTAYYQLKDELLTQIGDIEVSLTLMDENRFTIYTYFKIHVKDRITGDEIIDIAPKDPTYLLLQSLLLEVRNLQTSLKMEEEIRIKNENLRIESEDLRNETEELRKQAEEIRAAEWEELKQEVLDEISNIQGKDATINGYNTIEIRAKGNIELEQEENILTFTQRWKKI